MSLLSSSLPKSRSRARSRLRSRPISFQIALRWSSRRPLELSPSRGYRRDRFRARPSEIEDDDEEEEEVEEYPDREPSESSESPDDRGGRRRRVPVGRSGAAGFPVTFRLPVLVPADLPVAKGREPIAGPDIVVAAAVTEADDAALAAPPPPPFSLALRARMSRSISSIVRVSRLTTLSLCGAFRFAICAAMRSFAEPYATAGPLALAVAAAPDPVRLEPDFPPEVPAGEPG